MLRVVDEYWMDHIDAMDELQPGHPACGPMPRPTPSMAYKKEGFEMFEDMIAAIQEETIRRILVRPRPDARRSKRERVAKVTGESGGGDDGYRPKEAAGPQDGIKVGRNDPCPCGSGKKYKKCCYLKDKAAQ